MYLIALLCCLVRGVISLRHVAGSVLLLLALLLLPELIALIDADVTLRL